MKLEKFKKDKKQKKIIIASVIGILVVIGSIFLYKTYAYYEEKKTFNVLQGRIAEFSQGDLQLALTLDGESVD